MPPLIPMTHSTKSSASTSPLPSVFVLGLSLSLATLLHCPWLNDLLRFLTSALPDPSVALFFVVVVVIQILLKS